MRSRSLTICIVSFLSPYLAYGQEQVSVTNGFSENKQGCIRHPWQGEKIGYVGDSITDPNRYGDNIKKHWDSLKEWLGITPFVYGISRRQWDDVPRQVEELKKEHGEEVDAILVFMETNDHNSSMPIGEWFMEQEEQVPSAYSEVKEMVTQKKCMPVMTQDIYRGRINIGITQLKKLFLGKQIVLLTFLHCSLINFGDKNVQPNESYQSDCGEYIDAYMQAIKEVGDIWGIPIIDFGAVVGINPMAEEQLTYLYNIGYDRLHPDAEGQERTVCTLTYQLLALPAAL